MNKKYLLQPCKYNLWSLQCENPSNVATNVAMVEGQIKKKNERKTNLFITTIYFVIRFLVLS
jgi:hypothetical protein